MSGRARRRWAVALAAVAAVAMLLAGAGWWVATTEPGARWGFQRLSAILPGKLEIRELRGPLRGPLEVRHFTYRTERMEITADRLRLDWSLRSLLRRRLDIHALWAEDVRVLVGAAGDRPEERDSLTGPLPDLDLPVKITLRQGEIDGLQITRYGREPGIQIENVALSASDLGDSLRIQRLVVRSSMLDLDFSGQARPRGDYPVALSGRWAWRPPDGPVMAGEGTLVGTLDTLRVSQQLSQPFAGSVNGVIYRLMRRMTFDGDVAFTDLEPRRLNSGWPEGRYTGSIHARGNFQVYAARGAFHGTHPAIGATEGAFRVRYDPGRWLVDDLALTLPASGARLTANGTVASRGTTSWMRWNAEWRDLDWPLRGTPWLESNRGSAVLEGTPGDFHVRSEALLAGRDLPPGRWSLDARGGPGRLAIRTVVADLLDGRIAGTGVVAWSPRVTWRLGLQGERIDPAAVWPAWPGQVSFVARSEGAMGRGGPVGRMLVSRLFGTLRNQSLEGAGTLFARGGGLYALDSAAVQWGPNRVEASGELGRRWALGWKLDARSLGTALPHASGALAGEGRVDGPGRTPRVTGAVEGESLYVGRTGARTLRARGDLDLAPGGPFTLDAAAVDVDLGDRSLAHALASARGTSGRHQLRAAFSNSVDSLVTVLSGGVAQGEWRGTLDALDLVKRETGRWSLERPAAITASLQEVVVREMAWRSGAARLTLDGDWNRSGAWRIASDVDSVQLGLLEPWMPAELRLRGPVQGRVLARRTAEGRLFADVDLAPGPGEVLHLDPAGQWVPTRFERGTLRVAADGRALNASLALDFPAAGTVRGSLAMPAATTVLPAADARPVAALRQPIDGGVAVHLTNLAMLQGFLPELDATAGRLDAELDLGGTLGAPRVGGTFEIAEGQADVPKFGLQLRTVAVKATGTPGGRLAVDGSLRSGPGVLDFEGTADLGRGARPVADLKLGGRRVQVMNTRDASFLADPDLTVKLDGRRLDLNGQVTIPRGDFDIGSGNDQPVRSSADVVYSGADTLEGAAVEVYSRVRIVLGDRVWVEGLGLRARPTGSVLATDTPGLPTLGTGELRVEEGTYRIYGQELTIDRGRLVFGGGLIANPALDVRASRRAADGVVAGFEVAGTLQHPDVQVFSVPAMGQSQALSYILFGRSLQRASLSEGQIVSTMATSLGLPGTNMLAHGLASNLGIEQASIQAGGGELGGTALMLGHHLSPRLYVSYGMGLFESVSALRLRYVVSDRWTVETESAEQNRIDLNYTVER